MRGMRGILGGGGGGVEAEGRLIRHVMLVNCFHTSGRADACRLDPANRQVVQHIKSHLCVSTYMTELSHTHPYVCLTTCESTYNYTITCISHT